MDGLYPTTYCPDQPIRCKDGKTISDTGGTWVSSAYIKNRGQTSFVTQDYDEGWPDYLTNNTPATPVYVRVAPSQHDASKLVFWINGWERPRLVLTCGNKYSFNVVTTGEPFYFTSDYRGGRGNKGNITQVPPADYFKSTFTMNPGVPSHFYYQSANNPDMGGEVVVKGQNVH